MQAKELEKKVNELGNNVEKVKNKLATDRAKLDMYVEQIKTLSHDLKENEGLEFKNASDLEQIHKDLSESILQMAEQVKQKLDEIESIQNESQSL